MWICVYVYLSMLRHQCTLIGDPVYYNPSVSKSTWNQSWYCVKFLRTLDYFSSDAPRNMNFLFNGIYIYAFIEEDDSACFSMTWIGFSGVARIFKKGPQTPPDPPGGHHWLYQLYLFLNTGDCFLRISQEMNKTRVTVVLPTWPCCACSSYMWEMTCCHENICV